MIPIETLRGFYQKHLPGSQVDGHMLKAPCPFCHRNQLTAQDAPGTLAVYLNPASYFLGYYRCTQRCCAGGFHLHFGKQMGVDPIEIPGFDPDRESYVPDVSYPIRNLNPEIEKFTTYMREEQYAYFAEYGVSRPVVDQLKIGYNGRYLVFPYVMENGNAYAARCVLPGREEDHFWHGNESFFGGAFRTYNVTEIDRCEGGALFITDGEDNLLVLKELGYPAIAVPSPADLEFIPTERLLHVVHIFLLLSHTPEARVCARELATRLGFKVRLLHWPLHMKRGHGLRQHAILTGDALKKDVAGMIRASKAFSPFSSPESEHRRVVAFIEQDKGKTLLGFASGFKRMDQALDGLRGINIMGGPPKAGKSCFFMQISTEMAARQTPVIYYDFENGRQKIYLRTLTRMSNIPERDIRIGELAGEQAALLHEAHLRFKEILAYFRVVTDRKLNPDIMRRQIDFLKHETHRDTALVVLDSLHKLPFKDLSERRTGIDSWLRNMEAMRDEQNVAFLVISELSRGLEGGYDQKPDLGSFKESGDIEYSADNAMILAPDWDPLDPIASQNRQSTLWMVASRENSPGKVAEYVLEYPFWRFKEI